MITKHNEEACGMNKKSIRRKYSPVKKKFSSFMSDNVSISFLVPCVINTNVPAKKLFLKTRTSNKLGELERPSELNGGIRQLPFSTIQSKDEKILLCLSQLFFSLSSLEVQLAKLYTQPVIDTRKLAILADETAELKSVAREALAYFHGADNAVKPPFQPSGNDFSEPVDESQHDCGTNSNGYSFNDVGPTDSFKHGKECNQ